MIQYFSSDNVTVETIEFINDKRLGETIRVLTDEEGKELELTAKNNNRSINDSKKLHIQYAGIHQKNDIQNLAFTNVGIEKNDEKIVIEDESVRYMPEIDDTLDT